jgi:hypothetical protein
MYLHLNHPLPKSPETSNGGWLGPNSLARDTINWQGMWKTEYVDSPSPAKIKYNKYILEKTEILQTRPEKNLFQLQDVNKINSI